MTRKDFFSKVGFGAAVVLIPSCIGGLASSCSNDNSLSGPPTNVDFTLDFSTGTLASNGGYLVHGGVVVARTYTGEFLAVSAACTHQGTNVHYYPAVNKFICPNHGAQFNSFGNVVQGPAQSNLQQYNTQVTNSLLRVYS